MSLSQQQIAILSDSLLNDDVSSDDELAELYEEQNIPRDYIQQALALRGDCLIDPFITNLALNDDDQLITVNK